jgi:hypothetical protein
MLTDAYEQAIKSFVKVGGSLSLHIASLDKGRNWRQALIAIGKAKLAGERLTDALEGLVSK